MDIRERKIALTKAMLSLEFLIHTNVTIESKYQEYFEQNPIVFEVLGYTEFYPFTKKANKTLPKDQYTSLQPEPDFIVKNNDGIFEIFEIKTPIDKKLLIDRNQYRKRFTSEIMSYISQTQTYGDYFTRNPENRKNVEEVYGIRIQEDIPQKIIVGLEKNIDKLTIHKLCHRFKDRIDIITYDKILEDLENEYRKLYGLNEGIPGCSIHSIVKLNKSQKYKKNYFLDIASDTTEDRLSIYLNESRELCFDITASNGKKKIIIVNPDEVDFIDNFVYISFEFGVLEGSSFFSVSVNGEELEERNIYTRININFSNCQIYIGTDISKENSCNVQLGRFAYYDHTNTYKEKSHMFQEMHLPFEILNFQFGAHLLVNSTPPMKKQNGNDIRPTIYYRQLASLK